MPRRRTLRHVLTPAVVALAVGGSLACSGGGEGSAPDATGGSDEAADADGAAVYAASCAECHGDDLRGTDKGPSHLSQVYEPGHHPDDAFRNAIAQGSPAHHWNFGDMPPVVGLSDEEIDAVIAYVRDQQEEQGFEPYPPA